MKFFFTKSILPYTQGRPCTLSIDDSHADWTNEVQQFAASNNIELIRVPPYLTEIKSLDVRVNGELKMTQTKMQRLERIQSPDRKFHLPDALRYLRVGWEKIGKDIIISSWSPMNFD